MIASYTRLSALLAILSVSAAYQITPNVIDGEIVFPKVFPLIVFCVFQLGVPGYLNITKDPFVKIGSNYYFIESKVQKNWYAAYESCRLMDADLIAYESLEELKLISQYLIDRKIENSYWASGTDLAKQGKHVWLSTGKPVASNLWHKGEPNNQKGKEHCDHLWINKGVGGLNDYQCNVARLYICKSPQPKTASFIIW